MADQKVKVRIEADGREVDVTVKQAQQRLAALGTETDRLNRDFAKGKLSADKYASGLDSIDKEAKALEGGLKKAGASTKSLSSKFSSMASSVKASALKIGVALAAVVVAFRQIEKSAGEVGREKAFERALESQGIAADKFIAKLKDLSDNQIATADIILAGNRAVALGIQATDLPGLMTVAANAAINLGLTTSQAFDDIVTGIGRASPLILDNLGIIVDAVGAYDRYASSIGTTTEALTGQQKTIALTQAVLEGATDAIEDFETKQDSLTRAINRSNAAMKNALSALGSFGGGLAQLVTGQLAAFVLVLTLAGEAIVKLVRGITAAAQSLPVLGEKFIVPTRALKALDDGLDDIQQSLAKTLTDLTKGGLASIKWSLGIRDAGDEAGKAAPKMRRAAKAVEEVAGAQEKAIDIQERLNAAVRDHVNARKEEEEQLINTLAKFEALRKEQGEQVAIQAALAAGAKLTQGGTRIRFGSTGSRLVNQGTDSWITNIGGGTFYTAPKPRVLPDGSVEFQ